MSDTPVSLLIVDGDRESGRMLAREAIARGYRPRTVATVSAALELLERESMDVILVDLTPGAEAALALVSELRRVSADTEVIVMCSRTSMAAAIQWFDPEAFAFVRKTDVVQLFAAVGRAFERRRITSQNRRLVWELQTINEIASGIARSLELDDVLTGALQGLAGAMDAAAGAIRLRHRLTGVFETSARIGPAALEAVWSGAGAGPVRPSDLVIATRAAVLVEDFASEPHAPAGFPLRSAISVPLLAGDDLLGTLSLGSTRAHRFQAADQRLLALIGGQIVVAIRNAQLHQNILQAKREWERTFDAISDPIAVFNSRGELLRGNRALARHLSLPVTALPALSCHEVGFCNSAGRCHPGDETCVLREQGPRSEVTLPDGQIFSVTTFPIGLASEGVSVVQVAKNVTEEIRSARRLQQMSTELAEANGRLVAAMEQLRSTQTQLVQAEKLSAIGHLVAGVAHELNNPLTSVIGYAQLVDDALAAGGDECSPPVLAEDVRRIAEEAHRAARIVRNLLAFARRQSTARAPQDLADVCGHVLALREYEFRLSGVQLRTEFPADLPLVYADHGQLQQVVLNLVLNAEQAMRDTPDRRLSVTARADHEGGGVEIAVTDSGHGIETSHLSRVFDPFFTTRDVGQGTGLGLSICYGIVRDHGGTIRVESTPGSGTTFRVLLPARFGEPAVEHTNVLVAHPDQGEREFVAAILRGWGYRVVPAEAGAEALALYRRRLVHAAVIDRGIAGADLGAWKAVHAQCGTDVGLILTSVTADDAALEDFGRQAGVAVLAPPITLAALHAAVRAGVKEYV